MTATGQKNSIPKPRWDGSRVMFEIELEGERIACAISRSALQDLSGVRRFAGPDLLKGFSDYQARIEAIAVGKVRERPESAEGIVNIWTDDIDDLAPPTQADRAAAARAGSA